MNFRNMYRNMSLILSVPTENPAWCVDNLNNRIFPEKKSIFEIRTRGLLGKKSHFLWSLPFLFFIWSDFGQNHMWCVCV